MWTGARFKGDDCKEFQRVQFEAYQEAIRIIVDECDRLTQFAKRLLNDTEHHAWGEHEERFNHHTVQEAHDLLAAVWRYYHHEQRQGQLRFPKQLPCPTPQETPLRAVWLEWLKEEISNWKSEPELVRSVQVVLSNYNTKIGDAAERRLTRGIMQRFNWIPWT